MDNKGSQLVLFFDIDGLVCNNTFQGGKCYSDAKPIRENTDLVNLAFEKGAKVILWTNRGEQTGLDWKELTEEQLYKWGVKFHELRFGKPYYDFFFDDHAYNVSKMKEIILSL